MVSNFTANSCLLDIMKLHLVYEINEDGKKANDRASAVVCKYV
jgi:hypothetical protein